MDYLATCLISAVVCYVAVGLDAAIASIFIGLTVVKIAKISFK